MRERSAGVVVAKDGEYLLLHYEAGHWDLPKGHVEKGESDVGAALRELEEETGIASVELIDGFAESIHYFFKRDGKLVSKDVIFFLALVPKNEVTLSVEHKDFMWLPIDEALNKVTFETAKEVLRKADAFLKVYEK